MMFHRPDWAVGSYSHGPPAGGNSPNLSQQNPVPDHQCHAVLHVHLNVLYHLPRRPKRHSVL